MPLPSADTMQSTVLTNVDGRARGANASRSAPPGASAAARIIHKGGFRKLRQKQL